MYLNCWLFVLIGGVVNVFVGWVNFGVVGEVFGMIRGGVGS